MRTPVYEIRRIGDQYVPVLKEPYPGVDRFALLGGGALLMYMGATRRGWLGLLAGMAGASLLTEGVCGCTPLRGVLKRIVGGGGPDTVPGQTPSYQNDWIGRAPQAPVDLVEEQSMESFPASDPPG